MATAETWLGIDLGTQSVRAVLVDGAGGCLGSGRGPLSRDRREGARHEQDPDEWWSATCAATRAALSAAGGRGVGAVSIDSTSGTCWSSRRRRGRSARPRCTTTPAPLPRPELCSGAGAERLGHARIPDAGQLGAAQGGVAVAAWCLGRGDAVAHQADHIGAPAHRHRVAADTSHVLKTGYDLREPALARRRARAARVPTRGAARGGRRAAPRSAWSGRPRSDAHRHPGRHAGRGRHDRRVRGPGAAGALSPGDWCSSLGTTLVLKGSTAELLHDPAGAVYCHRNPDGGWLPGGASSTGAGVVARRVRRRRPRPR